MIIKPPHDLSLSGKKRVFLAGSIEQGKAEDWQKVVSEKLDKDFIVFNPRRDNWDSNLEQSPSNNEFVKQVNWELEALEMSDIIIMYFAKNTLSPISLLEFGLHIKSGKLRVVIPSEFWRYGNIVVTCKFYNIPYYSFLDEVIESLIN